MSTSTTPVRLLQSISKVFDARNSVPCIAPTKACTTMVGENVFGAFFNGSFSRFLNNLARIDTKASNLRQKIIRAGRSGNFTVLMETIQSLSMEEAEKLGKDFFIVTAKTVGKLGGAKELAQILKVIIPFVGYDKAFFKAFFIVPRTGAECIDLLEMVIGWGIADNKLLASRCFLVIIEKLSTQNKPRDMICVFEYASSVMNPLQTEEGKKMTLKALSILIGTLFSAKEDHTLIISSFDYLDEFKLEPTEIFFNKTLDFLKKNQHLLSLKSENETEAIEDTVINWMVKLEIQPSIVTFNTLMDIAASKGRFEKCFTYFSTLLRSGLGPDHFSYSMLTKALKGAGQSERFLEEPLGVLELYQKHEVPLSTAAFNSMIDIYLSMGKLYQAEKIFEELEASNMVEPDQQTFDAVIKGCCKQRALEKALSYFNKLTESYPDLSLNPVTFNALMDLTVKQRRLDDFMIIFQAMQEMEVAPDSFTYSILLNGLKTGGVPDSVIRSTLASLKEIIPISTFKMDEVFFNSILDVCSKYELWKLMEEFYQIMKDHKLEGSHVTFGILIKAMGKQERYTEAEELFTKMVNLGLRVNDVTYGCILDACAKGGNMKSARKIYSGLEKTGLNLNSIVFTTLIKGYMRSGQCTEAIKFFEEIQHHTNLPGMIITYNCSLDVLVQLKRIDEAIKLFETIDQLYSADLVSFSTIIKGLCLNDRKPKALHYFKKMLQAPIDVDISVVNLFLDFCANSKDYKYGIKGRALSDKAKITPNEVTFGIMIKLYGFSREIRKAFDSLDLMKAYRITPSIIIFTNLIHISFYSRKFKKVELAYRMLKKQGLKGDRLLYSKLIDGFLRSKDKTRAIKYLNFAFKERVPLKPDVCDKLENIVPVSHTETHSRIQQCRKFKHVRVAPAKKSRKKNIVSKVGPKRFNAANRRGFVLERSPEQDAKSNTSGSPTTFSRPGFGSKKKSPTLTRRGFGLERNGRAFGREINGRKIGNDVGKNSPKKQMQLFNFRNRVNSRVSS